MNAASAMSTDGDQGRAIVKTLSKLTKIHAWESTCAAFAKTVGRNIASDIGTHRFHEGNISQGMLDQVDTVVQLVANDDSVEDGPVKELIELLALVSRNRLPVPGAFILNNLSFITQRPPPGRITLPDSDEQDLEGFDDRYEYAPTGGLSKVLLGESKQSRSSGVNQLPLGYESKQSGRSEVNHGLLTTQMMLAESTKSSVSVRTTSPPRSSTTKIDFGHARIMNAAVDNSTNVGANKMDDHSDIQRLKKLIGVATKINGPGEEKGVERVLQFMADNGISICRSGSGSTPIWKLNNLANFIDPNCGLPSTDGKILYDDDTFRRLTNIGDLICDVTGETGPILSTAIHALGTGIYDHILEVYLDLVKKLMPKSLKSSFERKFKFHIKKGSNVIKNKRLQILEWSKTHSSYTSSLFNGRVGELIDLVECKTSKHVPTLLEFWNQILEARDEEIKKILNAGGVETVEKARKNSLYAYQIIKIRSESTTLEAMVKMSDEIEEYQNRISSGNCGNVSYLWRAETKSGATESEVPADDFSASENELISDCLIDVVNEHNVAKDSMAGKLHLGGPMAKHKAGSLGWHFRKKLKLRGFQKDQINRILGPGKIDSTEDDQGALHGFVARLEKTGQDTELISLLDELPGIIGVLNVDLPARPNFSVDENLLELMDHVKVYERIIDVMYYAFKYFIMNNGRSDLRKFTKKLFDVRRTVSSSIEEYIQHATFDIKYDELAKSKNVEAKADDIGRRQSRTIILPPAMRERHIIKDAFLYKMIEQQSAKEVPSDRAKMLKTAIKKVEINTFAKSSGNHAEDKLKRTITGRICGGIRKQMSGEKNMNNFFIGRNKLKNGNTNLDPPFRVPDLEGFNLSTILSLGMDAYTKKLKKSSTWTLSQKRLMSTELIIQLVKSTAYGYAMDRSGELH